MRGRLASYIRSGEHERGQALLIVVLIMVVALTIGLSAATRSVTNLRTSVEEESSQRAFSAAEAGVEKALGKKDLSSVTTSITGKFLANSAEFETKVNAVQGNQFFLNGDETRGEPIEKDDGIDVWLVPHNNSGLPDYNTSYSGKLQFFWGDNATDGCQDAALEVIVLAKEGSNYVSHHENFDGCTPSRAQGFAGAGTFGNPFDLKHSTGEITILDGLHVRVIPLYKKAKIGVKVTGGSPLPVQGYTINSLGKAGSTDVTSQTQRKIAFFKGYPKVPNEFWHLIFETY